VEIEGVVLKRVCRERNGECLHLKTDEYDIRMIEKGAFTNERELDQRI